MILALIGGIIIGIAVTLMLAFNGRVTGISGIISGILSPKKGDTSWRFLFLFGLFLGGVFLQIFNPESLESIFGDMKNYDFAIAGFLVGFGTLLGNGCTSGHGVCGISRLSLRSLVATFVFIFFGIVSVILFKIIRGGL